MRTKDNNNSILDNEEEVIEEVPTSVKKSKQMFYLNSLL
jgi:hypothetical protein